MLDLTRRIEVRHQKKGVGWGLYRVSRCSVLPIGSKRLYIRVPGDHKNCKYSSAGSAIRANKLNQQAEEEEEEEDQERDGALG